MNPILLASENESVVGEVRRLLGELIGPFVIEVIREDGRIALSRLEKKRYSLVLLPVVMRHYEALTVLRRLGPDPASPVVLLVPDTVEGLRTGWDALRRGAIDILPTKGDPAQRLKGQLQQRRRQLASALGLVELRGPVGNPWTVPPEGEPTIWLPELRHITAVADSLASLPRTFALLVRVPEGPRLRRVAAEEWVRTSPWPVRQLRNGDRLVRGQIHLFSDPDSITLVGAGETCSVRIHTSDGVPGSLEATHDLYRSLGRSTTRFRLVTGSNHAEAERARLQSALVHVQHLEGDGSSSEETDSKTTGSGADAASDNDGEVRAA